MPESASLIPFQFPRYVGIETINACNARCPFCPLFQGESRMSRETRPAKIMSPELFVKLLDEIMQWERKPEALFLNMNGEPLQDPQFPNRLAQIAEHGLGPIVDLQSNAQFLEGPVARSILAAGVARLVIGFDGASKEIYEQHRARCDYERVLTNIRNFVALRREMGAKTRIAIQYVRTKLNEHEVEQAYEMFSSILDPELDMFQDTLSKDWGDRRSSADIFVMEKPRMMGEPKGCQMIVEQLIVHSDGKVAACCWDYNLSVSSGGFGDVNNDSLLTIWQSRARNDVLTRLNSKSLDDKPEKCKSCMFLYEYGDLPLSGAKFSDPSIVSTSPYGYTYQFPKQNSETALPIAHAG